MTFPIDTTIPNAPNDPADDQPKMKSNFSNISSFVSVDHIAPGLTNNGKHKQVQLKAGAPTAFISGFGNLYSNTANTASQLFFSPDNSGNAYQLTRSNSTNFGTFSTYGTFGTVTANYSINGFWTFLPGGLIMATGNVVSTRATPQINPSTIIVSFPASLFSSANLVVTISPICKVAGTSEIHIPSVVSGSVTASGFTCNWDSSTTAYVGFSWTAIGK